MIFFVFFPFIHISFILPSSGRRFELGLVSSARFINFADCTDPCGRKIAGLQDLLMDNKSFIDTVAVQAGISPDEATALADAFRSILVDAAAELDSIAVPGFGTFEPRRRAERISVHPGTGRRLLVPPKVVMAFRPSSSLKNRTL